MRRIGVLLSGRGSNFIAIHESIKIGYLEDVEIAFVISDKAEAIGLEYASCNNIDTYTLNRSDFSSNKEYNNRVLEICLEYNPDLICLAGYMKILGEPIVESFPHKIMNIHPSLLPSFPGLDAQAQAIGKGVRYSGCTVHFVDTGVDTGPIILQAVVEVLDDDSPETLGKRVLKQEHKIYSEAIKLFLEDRLTIDNNIVKIKRL